eukprot:4551986-Pyramimonas_sp.AAC.1
MDLNVSEVRHVQAHRSRSNIEQLEGDELNIARGNTDVDLLAKAGAELDASFGKHRDVEDLACRVRW